MAIIIYKLETIKLNYLKKLYKPIKILFIQIQIYLTFIYFIKRYFRFINIGHLIQSYILILFYNYWWKRNLFAINKATKNHNHNT
jgi:hypothetical protein